MLPGAQVAARRLMVAAATVSVFGASTAQDASNAAGTVAMTDPLFTGCTVTLLGCYTEGADDPHGRKVKDPAGADIPLKLRSLPYGTACDVCDAGLNQCDAPPNAAGGNWPKAPSAAPACDQAKMTLEYCAKVCMEWFGRSTPGDPMVHDVVYAGAQYGEQCWCMPTMFPATGVDVKKAENTATQCDVKCKADQQHFCGGGWHNTVIEIDCSAAWGWPFVGVLLVCTAAYALSGVYGPCSRGQAAGLGPRDALRVHPHYGRWMEVVALVADGVAFTRSRRQHSNHLATKDSGTDELAGGNGKSRGGSHQRKTSTTGSKTSSRSAKRNGRDRRMDKVSHEGGITETLLVASAGPPPVAASASAAPLPGAHTSAGGGGRWVHVPT